MTTEKRRTHNVKLRVNESEKASIEIKSQIAGCQSTSEYLRRIALGGAVLQIDQKTLDFLKRNIAGACSNVNQMARVANSNGVIRRDELHGIETKLEEIYRKIADLPNCLVHYGDNKN